LLIRAFYELSITILPGTLARPGRVMGDPPVRNALKGGRTHWARSALKPVLSGRRRPDRTGLGAADANHSGGYVIGADDPMPFPGLRRFGATPPRERGDVTQERTRLPL
jgi:hypothetical protein